MIVKNMITEDTFVVRGTISTDNRCIIQHYVGLLYIHIDNEMWCLND